LTNKIKKIKLKIIKNRKGDLLKYLTKSDKYLSKFGETYFNEIKKNQKKGWILHKKYFCLLAVPYGKVEFNYKKNIKKKANKIILSKNNYSLIVVPPKTWFSFKGVSKISLLANTINGIHDDKESVKHPI
tara:strand:- start:29 stop:418 length:390 start_codon:yes stop_codon:yes gene_type:complete